MLPRWDSLVIFDVPVLQVVCRWLTSIHSVDRVVPSGLQEVRLMAKREEDPQRWQQDTGWPSSYSLSYQLLTHPCEANFEWVHCAIINVKWLTWLRYSEIDLYVSSYSAMLFQLQRIHVERSHLFSYSCNLLRSVLTFSFVSYFIELEWNDNVLSITDVV